MENLDIKCAQLGERIGSKVEEKILTDSLGVLQEQGVYSFFLYLRANKKNDGEFISEHCLKFMADTPEQNPLLTNINQKHNPFPSIISISEDLDNLLFARDLLLQALIYARYHAKINSKKETQ